MKKKQTWYTIRDLDYNETHRKLYNAYLHDLKKLVKTFVTGADTYGRPYFVLRSVPDVTFQFTRTGFFSVSYPPDRYKRENLLELVKRTQLLVDHDGGPCSVFEPKQPPYGAIIQDQRQTHTEGLASAPANELAPRSTPTIEVTFPPFKKSNSWSSKEISEWLANPARKEEGNDDYMFGIEGNIHPPPKNCEVRIWAMVQGELWPQAGGDVSEKDGSWGGKVWLRMESDGRFRKRRVDIGINLFERGSDYPICSEIYSISE